LYINTSRLCLVDFKDLSTTWGMKTIPPQAAVGNFGQCTNV